MDSESKDSELVPVIVRLPKDEKDQVFDFVKARGRNFAEFVRSSIRFFYG